jgi:hypothetical protein
VVITDEIREACAFVAERSTSVRVLGDQIGPYADSLVASGAVPRGTRSTFVRSGTTNVLRVGQNEAAYWLTLDAINFGSGWFPTLRKRSEPTGYRTIAAGLRRRFDQHGPWTAGELAEIDVDTLAAVLDQDPQHELLKLFSNSLRDLGGHLLSDSGGSFTALVDGAGGSAVALVEQLAGWDSFADASPYGGRTVPFLKRAQIAAADLSRAGVAAFDDLPALTLFADNLVPHVLRLDGVLGFAPELVARIDRGELIVHGSPEEVEIRACAVHAVELIVAAALAAGVNPTAAQIDEALWNRGQGTDYKSVPRHRSRTIAY